MANRKIAYTLGRGQAYVSDMSSTSGYMGAKYFQEFGPSSFDMSSASGYMGGKYVQEFGPRILGAYPLAHTPLREVSKERGSCTWPYEDRAKPHAIGLSPTSARPIFLGPKHVNTKSN